jgi:alkanesulfonate monooxygenase SsuD/methylene tetrahydromethanopterin reductase-like flavin-dependent oxidoreductase (luciferase family)
MRYGLNVCTLGDYADPRRVVDLARAAEDAGWESLFVWDHLAFAWGMPSGDPWVTLAAVAQSTDRLLVGTGVTALPRRRPHVVAAAAASLQLLSGGRFVFGAGLGGVEAEFTAFGDPFDARVRAERLDEALGVVTALWRGEPVEHHGQHYTVEQVTLAPAPGRIPVWIGGDSPPALRRAARWDGWIVGGDDPDGTMVVSPESLRSKVEAIGRQGGFDVAIAGVCEPGGDVRAYAEAGATWWLESMHGLRGSHEALLKRIASGPPNG